MRLFVILFFLISLNAYSESTWTKEKLNEISQMGKDIYHYRQACLMAADSVVVNRPDGVPLSFYAKKTGDAWEVAFGNMNIDRMSFLVSIVVTIQDEHITDYKDFTADGRPVANRDFFYRAALANETILESFDDGGFPYFFAYFKTDTNIVAYAVLDQTNNFSYVIGRDKRFEISFDGSKILKEKDLHNSVMKLEHYQDGMPVKSTYSPAFLTMLPTATDVYFVLVRIPRIPHYVITKQWVYKIDTDASIIPIESEIFFRDIEKYENDK